VSNSRDEREYSFASLTVGPKPQNDGFKKFFFLVRGKVMSTSELSKKFDVITNIDNLAFHEAFSCFRTLEAWKQMLAEN
jgi:hypothetical protein